MKLKRILSLALSGVLAVSMLTACGIGGGSGIFGAGDQSSSFANTLNGKLDDETAKVIRYRSNDSELKNAIRTIANVVTEQTANSATGENFPANLITTVETMTEYGTLSTGAAWGVAEESGTYVKVYVFNANNDDYNTLDEVATEVKDSLATIDLPGATGDDDDDYDNTYEGNVAAYKVTIPTASSAADAEDAEAWVIGVAIEQTATEKQ